MIDLLALLVLLVGAVIGARRGTVAMVLGWAAIAAGYAGAWLLYRPVGGFLERTLHLARVVALARAKNVLRRPEPA